MKALRLPLFLQTLGLIIVSLLVAQTLSVVVILNLPPPRPLVYTVAEVVHGVRGLGAAAPESSRIMMTHFSRWPPQGRTGGARREHFRNAVAEALGIARSSVVVAQSGPQFVAFGVRKPWDQQREFLLDAPEPLLLGRFEIGILQGNGRWLLVAPKSTFGIDPWQQRLVLVFALAIICVAPLSWIFSRRIAAPIGALAAGAERLGRDPGAPQLDVVGPAEVALAASAFNAMQGRLRAYIEERMGMLAAIAHDLRTPLTRLRFRVDGVAEPLRSHLITDIDQMEAMVASTMSFIRDSSQPHDRRKLEISSLVETVMDEAALTGANASVGHTDRVVINGDPLALKRLIVNLVENALKFGSTARATVTKAGNL